MSRETSRLGKQSEYAVIGTPDYWVLPSRIFEKHAVANKRGFTRLTLTETKQFDLTRYHNNFDLLKK